MRRVRGIRSTEQEIEVIFAQSRVTGNVGGNGGDGGDDDGGGGGIVDRLGRTKMCINHEGARHRPKC